MMNYKLIGYPLGHSMSPWIHEHLFAISGHEGTYALEEIAPESLENAIPELKQLNGFNITIPHKVAIIPYLDELDETAEWYYSVNCVVNKDGKLTGYNTDCIGFLRSVPPMKERDRVLLIGSGGVGRMMATEAYLKGTALTIVEKNIALAEALKQELESTYQKGKIRVLDCAPEEDFDLLMNATPVGMYPNIDRCPVSDEVIVKCSHVFDVIYNPTETLLVKKAKAMGKTAVGGSAMLVWQAVNAHEIWYDFDYDPQQIDDLIKEMEQEVNRLSEQITEMSRDRQANVGERTLRQTIEIDEKINALKRQRSKKQRELFAEMDMLEDQNQRLQEEIRKKLEGQMDTRHIMTIAFEIV